MDGVFCVYDQRISRKLFMIPIYYIAAKREKSQIRFVRQMEMFECALRDGLANKCQIVKFTNVETIVVSLCVLRLL